MIVPGSNILNLTRNLIAFQKPVHSRWLSNERNDAGIDLPTYAQAVPIDASVQAVSQEKYESLGLDLQKDYISVFTSTPLRDLQRNGSCDLLDYGGRRFNVESNTDWLNQDGWRASICVDIGPTPQ